MKQIIVEDNNINASFQNESNFNGSFQNESSFNAQMGVERIIETGNYEKLSNKPILNGNTIIGDKVSNDYGLQDKMDYATTAEIESILYLDV